MSNKQPITPAMKFSICSTGLKGMSIEEVLEAAARIELDGVELWDGHLEVYLDSGGTTYELGRYLLEHKLSVPAISTYAAFSQTKKPISSRSSGRPAGRQNWAARGFALSPGICRPASRTV
ncbi:hypothetical protein HMSSN139_15210 [Paenibacillus sp. HMSSN-139]|nr:hypothetical protein HMSSN139_15210 [Paenibacillus sp. HMSSN-139]